MTSGSAPQPRPPELAPPELAPPELHDRAARWVQDGQRRLLGLAGTPGSGKSTLAEGLGRALWPGAVVVPADGFHLANRVLHDLGLADRKGAPETFDVAGLHSLLGRLRRQEEEVVYAPEFVRRLEEPVAGAIAVRREAPLVIIEGNYLLLEEAPWSGTATLLDEVWYLDVDAEVRRDRLVSRHRAFGRSEEEARHWALGNDERNAGLVASTRSRADRIIRGDGNRPDARTAGS